MVEAPVFRGQYMECFLIYNKVHIIISRLEINEEINAYNLKLSP